MSSTTWPFNAAYPRTAAVSDSALESSRYRAGRFRVTFTEKNYVSPRSQPTLPSWITASLASQGSLAGRGNSRCSSLRTPLHLGERRRSIGRRFQRTERRRCRRECVLSHALGKLLERVASPGGEIPSTLSEGMCTVGRVNTIDRSLISSTLRSNIRAQRIRLMCILYVM